jgi:hypothetical protein
MSAAGRSSGIGAGSMLAAARLDHPGARCRRGVGDTVGMEYVSRVPRPPLDGLIDDLYYLEGAPPYARLTLPPMPSALLIVNLGAPFRIRAGTDVETAEYADGCVVTVPTRALEFGYPLRTRPVEEAEQLGALGVGHVQDAPARMPEPGNVEEEPSRDFLQGQLES